MTNISENYRAAALIWHGSCEGEFVYRDEPDWIDDIKPDVTARDVLEDWMNNMKRPDSFRGHEDTFDLVWEVKICEFDSTLDYKMHDNYTVVDECCCSENNYRKARRLKEEQI